MKINFSIFVILHTAIPDDESASVTDTFRFNDMRVTSLQVTTRYVTLRHKRGNTMRRGNNRARTTRKKH